jgi:hypothetical protein
LCRPPAGFVSGSVQQHVPSPYDLVEGPGVAAGIGVAAVPDPAVERADNLLPVSASRHTQKVMRITSAVQVNVTAHR